MKYIIYCAMFQQRLVYDTIYSVLSLFEVVNEGDFGVIIYTDSPSLFSREVSNLNIGSHLKEKIIIEEINSTLIKSCILSDYPYAIKIHILKEFFLKYKQNALFIDSDTFILKDIMPLFDIIKEGKFLLYNKVVNIFDQLFNIRENIPQEVRVTNGRFFLDECSVSLRHFHYNSGMIGMNYQFAPVLEDVLKLCYGLYRITGDHASEEMAFSVIFQDIGEIAITYDYAYHYSNQDVIRYLLAVVLKIFLHKDKEHFNDYLSLYRVNLKNIELADIAYDDLLYFVFIFTVYRNFGMVPCNTMFLKAAEMDPRIANKSRQGFYNFYNKFYSLFSEIK